MKFDNYEIARMRRHLMWAAAIFCTLTIAISAKLNAAVVIGGWDDSRGGDSAIVNGGEGAMLRNELAANFPGTTLAESSTLTPAFLNSINVLYISAVQSGHGEINPLSSSEQVALATWVNSGGRALLVTDNAGFYAASNSMVAPFGMSVDGAFYGGLQFGTVTNHVAFPAITDGPFGTISTFEGAYVGGYNPGPAATLGSWNAYGGTALAALYSGLGRVVFYADNTMMGDVAQNKPLLDNTMAFLIPTGVPEPSAYAIGIFVICAIAFLAKSSGKVLAAG